MVKERAESQPKIDYYMHLPYSVLLHEIEDEGAKYWIAEVPELPGCKSHGSTVEDAVASIEEAKRDWILDSLEKGDEVPTPVDRDRYSGKTLVRMSRSLHRALSLMAEAEKLSLNQLIVTILAKEVGGFNVLNRLDKRLEILLNQVSSAVQEQQAPPSWYEQSANQGYKGGYVVVGTSPNLATSPGNAGVFIEPAQVTTIAPKNVQTHPQLALYLQSLAALNARVNVREAADLVFSAQHK